jgi:hypothetical protein
MAWAFYMALEPFVRRHWPALLTSWTRVLSGKFRDPLVGRDFLAGAAVGIAISLVFNLQSLVPGWLGFPPAKPLTLMGPDSLLGGRRLVGMFPEVLHEMLLTPIIFVFFVVLLRLVLRRVWLAATVFLVLMVLPALGSGPLVLVLVSKLVLYGLILTAILRFGVLAVVVSLFYSYLSGVFPLTLDVSAWYFGASLVTMLLAGGLAAYAFYLSLGGRTLLRGDTLDG